ncbi:uncharacterized protein [Panulirus ornatus]|uniref:uncharacterized protein isoform X2 n=1 Tax=Panulirus ornatus TaxID=150431 RepID=UPI003A8BF1D3
MSEINAKMKANGYNPFGSDDPSSEQRRRRNLGSSMSSLSGGEERKGGCLATLLRVICCCFYSDLQHPLLSPSIVTHRKISRVVSTESLTKEGVAMSERPTYAHMMSREKLLHARAHNRLYSNHPNAPYTHTTALTTPTSAATRTVARTQPVGVPEGSHQSPTSAASPSSPLHRPSSPSHSPASSPCPSLPSASPRGLGGLSVKMPDSPSPEWSSRPMRPTQLSLAIHAARGKGNKTPTPSGGSPCSTPSTPRSRSGSWGVMRAGFTSLVKAVTTTTTTTHHSGYHQPAASLHPDDLDERTPEEVDDIPEANCVRPTTGGVDNPARECYGSISINILGRQGRWVRAVVCSLSGLPWVGGSGGFMLEVSVEPGGRPRWMVLPHAHGPNVTVKLEAMVKGPRESKTKKKRFVKVSVWVCGRVWRHAAIGHALTPLNETPGTLTIPLHHHTQLTEDLGLVEVSLRCDYVESSAEVGNTVQGEVTLTVEVLRAKNLRPYHPGVLAKAAPSRMRDHVEVVCRVGLWVKGERVDRESSMPVQLPVTQNPVIRSRTVFILQRDSLQHAAIILKVLYTCRWGGEDTVGRVQLGPLLYLGTLPDQASQALTHDYKTSITLSHWGQALKTPGPTTMWHHLQL